MKTKTLSNQILVASTIFNEDMRISTSLAEEKDIEPNIGDEVVYIPSHLLEGRQYKYAHNWGYPNGIQPGFLASGIRADNTCFVRYWLWDDAKGIFLPELRTKANSELTPTQFLFWHSFWEDADIVNKALLEVQRAQR